MYDKDSLVAWDACDGLKAWASSLCLRCSGHTHKAKQEPNWCQEKLEIKYSSSSVLNESRKTSPQNPEADIIL